MESHDLQAAEKLWIEQKGYLITKEETRREYLSENQFFAGVEFDLVGASA